MNPPMRSAPIRLCQLSVFNRAPRIMAVLKGYFDDSRTDPKVSSPNWCVAGYVGDDHHWKNYLDLWPLVLATHDVPYFHAKEMLKPNGPYQKWHPLHEHKTQINAFMADLVKVITQSYLRGFSCVVRMPDLDRFNSEKGLNLEPYPLAVYGCMIVLSKEYSFESMELFFDRVEKVGAKTDKAREYADSDQYYKEDRLDRMLLNGLTEHYNFKRVIELQSADLLVDAVRKNHLLVNDWFEIADKPTEHEARLEHFSAWAHRGTEDPPLRKTLEVLVGKGAPHWPFVWDYGRLCEAHEIRGGVWA